MKNIKHTLKAIILILVFITGVGRNAIYAKSISEVNHATKYETSKNSSENIPFFFQPIEDYQSEDDDHLSIDNDLQNYCFSTISFISYSKVIFKNCKLISIQQRIWCLNNNFRL